MPELPEVETICQALACNILNHKILKVNRITNHNLREAIPQNLFQVEQLKIKSVTRRSKYILITLDNGFVIVIHLGMSGKILMKDRDYQYKKHDHIEFVLDNLRLVYNDPRRFGVISLIEDKELQEHRLFKNLGIEPFSPEFTDAHFVNLLKNKKQAIKQAIMDASLLVGVGNIYACESLFLSKISPLKPACELSAKEVALLKLNILKVLSNAIRSGGSSLKDYANINGEKGYFQNSFKVYSRAGEQCFECSSNIIRVKQAGRSSFYCSNCQK
jgi:formamidopyrimidine-DNA glycosylase